MTKTVQTERSGNEGTVDTRNIGNCNVIHVVGKEVGIEVRIKGVV